jgi:hypothetical protein
MSTNTLTPLQNNTKQKRRKYSTRACVFCRNRHKKCDGGQPCYACEQRKQECVYPEQQKKRGPKPRSSLHGVVDVVGSSSNGSAEGNCPVNNQQQLTSKSRQRDLVVGVSNPVQGKTKRRRLSNNSEERLPNPIEIMADCNSHPERLSLYHSLQQIILMVQQHPHAYPFLHPVAISDAPDYYEVIKYPMDLSTVLKKINAYQYLAIDQFCNDISLLVNNCKKYNQGTPTAYLIEWAIELQKFIMEEIAKITYDSLIWCTQPVDSMEQIDIPNNPQLDITDLSMYDDINYQTLYDLQDTWPGFDNDVFSENNFISPAYLNPEINLYFFGEEHNM